MICFLICLILIVAGLRPFNFKPQNKVEWLLGERGVRFFGQGMIYGPGPLDSKRYKYLNGDSNSLVFWAQAGPQSKRAPARIISFWDGQKSESLFIGQRKSELVFWYKNVTRTSHKDLGYRGMVLGSLSDKDVKHFIGITSGNQGTAVYLDGNLAKNRPDFLLRPENIEMSGNIVLGNSPTGEDDWKGRLMGLAIYNRSLTSDEISQSYLSWKAEGHPHSQEEGLVALYLFDEGNGQRVRNHTGPGPHLEIPVTFRPLRKSLLSPPWRDFRLSPSYLSDAFINIAGFVPFGFFLTALFLKTRRLAKRRVLIVTLLGGAMSLAIELLQFFLPTRNSNLNDLLCNIVGTALGIAAFSICRPFFATRKWAWLAGKKID